MENNKSVTSAQLRLLLDELEENPTLCYDKVLRAPRNVHDVEWNLLADKLNTVSNGAKRTVVHWKFILNNWKMNVKKQANSNGNMENTQLLDDMGRRLLCIIQDEDSEQLDGQNENENFRSPQLRMTSSRKRLRPPPEEFAHHRQPKGKSLKTIFDNNVDDNSCPEKMIMQMQLDRLQQVSLQLESHIQDVQNRIQMIKDMWQHDCVE